jgi:hypothetical protein
MFTLAVRAPQASATKTGTPCRNEPRRNKKAHGFDRGLVEVGAALCRVQLRPALAVWPCSRRSWRCLALRHQQLREKLVRLGGIACRQAEHWQRDWYMLGGSFRSTRINRAASRRERPLRAARPSASMNCRTLQRPLQRQSRMGAPVGLHNSGQFLEAVGGEDEDLLVVPVLDQVKAQAHQPHGDNRVVIEPYGQVSGRVRIDQAVATADRPAWSTVKERAMAEETFIAGKMIIFGLIAVVLLGAVAFALYWFVGRRDDEG